MLIALAFSVALVFLDYLGLAARSRPRIEAIARESGFETDFFMI